MNGLNRAQKQRIIEILDDEGYELLGTGEMDGKVIVAIHPKDYKKISEMLKIKIESEIGVETIINL